ncbi:AAA family ATPase [Dysgonomonas capnocytophagoides]|uniref:AAA family ATPase n=1 Tax=Dysgonomonas capnocytophagoides TaxID=45254 RepID=UPI00291F7936|nr:AAA family ATPase [Dysgonomonas capnocytophagoides]
MQIFTNFIDNIIYEKMSILNDIIDWVENKPVFWQVMIDRLIRNNSLTEDDIIEIKEISKVQYGLSNFEYIDVDFEDLREFANNATSSEDILLSKIYNIDNINALSTTNELKFALNGLTVVYGDNGSGKSSYTSILKHTCNTRGHKPTINDNLYDSTCIGKDKKANIEYTKDKRTFNSVNFINSTVNNSILKSVDVFDSFSANHYIEGEDEIAFIPQGLSIIEKLAIYLRKIEDKLNEELNGPKLRKFDYSFIEVADDSTAKRFLNGLNSKTKLDDLRAESIWTLAKELKIEELKKEIDKIKATDPRKNLKENEEKIKRFEVVKDKIQLLENSLTGEAINELKSTLYDYSITNEALKTSSEEAFAELPIKGVGNNQWKLLWESARIFYNESVGAVNFPEVQGESKCPLCLQKLDEEAKQRFTDFEKFVKDDIQKRHDTALSKLNAKITNLNRLNLSFEEQKPTVTEIEVFFPDFSQELTQYLESLSKHRDYLLGILNSKKTIEIINEIDIENTPKTLTIKLIKNLVEANEKLKVQSIEESLKPLIKELNQLNGEKKLFEFKPKLAREVCRQRRVELINQCINNCNTRSVTTLSNQLTTTYITQSLKQNFKTELRNLGFKNIKIETETKGKKGKQYHYLRIDEENANNIALKDILSEGEHRCISLAMFLSEVSISEHKSTIIFDDPVSSLDHKWRYKISKRIVEESKIRQVIVFTHDITFLLMLQEHSAELACDIEITSLTRRPKETGIIASNPPWDALSIGKRIGLLKNAYQGLEKIERTETEEVYKERAKMLYGKLRETWERFVEEVLLNGAIQRFGRSVQTQRLSKVVDLTDDDYHMVDLNMSKCSTYFTGHDTAGALIEEMPDSAEFLSDIATLETFASEIKKRRK